MRRFLSCSLLLEAQLGRFDSAHNPSHLYWRAIHEKYTYCARLLISKAGVAGVYNRAVYLDDRRIALTKWADFLFRLSPGS
jgi:hypothetical protein